MCPKCGCPLKKRLGCFGGIFAILLIIVILAVLNEVFSPERPGPLPEAPNVRADKRDADAKDQAGRAKDDVGLEE